MEVEFHIGKRVREIFDQRRKKKLTSIKVICGQLSIGRDTIYRIFNSKSLHSDLIYKLSIYLEHDFFKDLSTKHFSHIESREKLLMKKEIDILKQELKFVKRENDLLRKLNKLNEPGKDN